MGTDKAIKRIKERILTPEEIPELNQRLKSLSRIRLFINRKIGNFENDRLINEICIYNTPSNIHIIGRGIFSEKLEHYVFNDEGKMFKDIDVCGAYRSFVIGCKPYNIVDIVAECPAFKVYTSSAFMYYDTKYNNTYLPYAIGYDMNNCYLAALNTDVPVMSTMRKFGIVTFDEIGFDVTGEKVLYNKNNAQEIRSRMRVRRAGECATYIFKRQKSPFKRYIKKMSDNIQFAKQTGNKPLLGRLKTEIVVSIGNLQNHNPFLRCAIVEEANRRIQSLIDENTVYCNTDCIISTVKRGDIPISPKVGDFKIENEGGFIYNGFNFKWDNGKENQRGHKIGAEKRHIFNWETRQIEEI